MDIFAVIAEQRIREAQERGDFDNLPGAGKPLELEDDSHMPEDLRMAYKVLRNAGYVPPEIAERKEAESLLDLLETCTDEHLKVRQMRKLDALLFRMQNRARSAALVEHDEYYRKIVNRVTVLKKRNAGDFKRSVLEDAAER